MATRVIPWNEGDGSITATYEGSGNGPISLSTAANEGIDREQVVDIATSDGTRRVSVRIAQIGLREVFNVTEGAFEVSEGSFNVLKSN